MVSRLTGRLRLLKWWEISLVWNQSSIIWCTELRIQLLMINCHCPTSTSFQISPSFLDRGRSLQWNTSTYSSWVWRSSSERCIEGAFVLHVFVWIGLYVVLDVASQLHNILGRSREAIPPVLLLWYRRDEADQFDQLETKERWIGRCFYSEVQRCQEPVLQSGSVWSVACRSCFPYTLATYQGEVCFPRVIQHQSDGSQNDVGGQILRAEEG